MKTDTIEIRGDLHGKETALQAAEKFISYNSFRGKDAVHIRLLTEEVICMVNGIMENFRGELTLESTPAPAGHLCRIRLTANKTVNALQENRLMSISTSGKNEAAKGILGKIREAVRISMQRSAEEVNDSASSPAASWYAMGTYHNAQAEADYVDEYYTGYWSLNTYRDSLSQQKKEAPAEWDELEKSVIANISDDVKVGIRSGATEVVIEKFVKG